MALVSRLQWRTRTILAIALSLLFALSATTLAFARETLTQISSDPFTNTTSQHKTEVEPDTYSFGSTVVSAFQVGRFTNGGSSDLGWATSHNGGKTWVYGFLPGVTVYTGGTYDRASDAAVTYDARHRTWMISILAFDAVAPTNAILTSRSTDGGLTWSNPVTVSMAGPNQGYDKNWIVCDNTTRSPFYGNCYTEWDSADSNQLFNHITMSTSSDGGSSWGTPKHTADNANGIGGQPLTQPNGTVIVPIIGEPTDTTADIASFLSTNGGKTWSSTVIVSSLNQYNEKASIRNGGLPSAEIDSSGKVYVTWQDCRFESNCSANDIVMTTSTDGTTWTPVTRIPIAHVGSGADYFTPGLGVDKQTHGKKAHLALTYYYFPDASCSTSTCQLYVGFITSTNGGISWSKTEQLAGPMKLNWLAFAGGYFAGDYVSTSFMANGTVVPVFAVAFAPSNGHLNEAIYTTPEGVLKVEGGSITSSNDRVLTTSSSTVPSRIWPMNYK